MRPLLATGLAGIVLVGAAACGAGANDPPSTVDGGVPDDGQADPVDAADTDAAIPPPPVDYGGLDRGRMPVEDWRDTQWVDPGGWTTIDVTTRGLPANAPSLDAAVEIQRILAETSGRRRLHFPAGTYYLKSTLAITVGDLWLAGDGPERTIFRIEAPGSANAEIAITGRAPAGPIDVMAAVAPGATSLTLRDATGIVAGDVLQLFADDAPLANGGRAWSSELYAQLVRVTAVTGDIVELDMKVLLDYPLAYRPRVRRIEALRHVRVDELLVHRVHEPAAENTTNLRIARADRPLITRVESSFSGRNHISLEEVKDGIVEDTFVHDTWKTTTGGYGYGISLIGTTGCRVSNNKASRLRHHVILQLGASHNVVSYNSAEAPLDYNDVALHATYAYLNLFEGNTFTEGFADRSKDGWTDIEATTGPGNTWFRNRVARGVGNQQGGTQRQNVIGNDVTGLIWSAGGDHYIGANRVAGALVPGAVAADAAVPASLYLTAPPTFFAAGDRWPAFGPGVDDWGATSSIPASAPPAAARDRVRNPGFESGDLSAWGTAGNFTVTNQGARSGAHALRLAGAGQWANVQQTIAVAPHTRYTWSLWGISSSDGGRLKVLTTTSDALADCGRTRVTPTWTQYFCSFETGDDDHVRLYLGDGGGTHRFDDVQVY